MKKEAMNVKKSMVGCVRGFGEKKRKKRNLIKLHSKNNYEKRKTL